MQRVCITRRCPHLSDTGCTLGNSKPFGCDLYPLAYDPASRRFFLDSECPLAEPYVDQLATPDSDASRHLTRMAAAIRGLERTDLNYLEANFAFDREYFSLTPVNRTPD
jgi:Fe-S-cluster containining protein